MKEIVGAFLVGALLVLGLVLTVPSSTQPMRTPCATLNGVQATSWVLVDGSEPQWGYNCTYPARAAR